MLRFVKMINILTQYMWIGITIWLAILTFFFVRYIKHYQKLTRSPATHEDLKTLLEKYSSEVAEALNNIEKLDERLQFIEEDSLKHIQKFAVIRFNPFDDAGGDQSFAAALLDNEGNGFIISSLHGREATRVYGKPVEKGKPVNYGFSEEEEKVVRLALEE